MVFDTKPDRELDDIEAEVAGDNGVSGFVERGLNLFQLNEWTANVRPWPLATGRYLACFEFSCGPVAMATQFWFAEHGEITQVHITRA
jgi:hypothetical protein